VQEQRLETVPLDLIDEPATPSRLAIEESSLHELARSIARLGLLEPVGLQPIDGTGRYRLVYGHRRLRAVQHLGWYDVPAIILPDHLSEAEARQHENSQRVQLTPVEEAREIARWIDAGTTLPAIASILGKSDAWVAARYRLLRYPDDVLDAIHRHGLPLSVADQLARVEHAGYRQYLLDDAVAHGATAATAAVWVQHYEANRARVEANADTVEQVAATRASFVVTVPCEYCDTPTDLQRSRVWRLCPDCTLGLQRARAGLPQEDPRHVRA
jgi:ParB family chromosome partitioning protein